MINTREPEDSPLLKYPLAEKAGGNHFHPGGKHWESKSDPEWQILDEWAHGQKATASSR
jgi:frataxin-like iron-binding protein CyaY